jgi:hypothetical protein
VTAEQISIGIDSFFEIRDTGNFTDEAVLYQDILKYAIVTKKSKESENSKDYSFSIYDITKWLRYNNKNYVDRYNKKPLSSPQTEIESLLKGTKSKIENFIKLELIKPFGTRQNRKGGGVVSLYTYTPFGFLIAWSLMSDRECNVDDIISGAYDSIQSIFRTGLHAPSSSIFYSDFFKMCKQAGMFQDIIDLIKMTLLSDDPTVTTVREFIEQIQRLDFKDLDMTIFYNFILWDQTLNRLDPQIQNLVMFNLKVDLERRMDLQVKNDRNYEKLRFKVRDDHRSIALEGYCAKCQYYIPMAVDLLEYKIRMICANTVNQPIMFIRCPNPNCETENSFRIPFLN